MPDDREAIGVAIVDGTARHRFVVTTGGTGLTPRDVTGILQLGGTILGTLNTGIDFRSLYRIGVVW